MKKVLLIGAGIGQYFLAKKIKERGSYLITVTLPGDQPVIPLADKVCYEDVFNKEAVLEIAKREKIDAVISDQNDMMMPTVSYVAEKMGLPGNSIKATDSYCNKNHYRANCDRLSIPVPAHCPVSEPIVPDKMKGVSFPWVVKPADAQSSVGVAKVESVDEYLDAVAIALKYSKTHSAIVEEFFCGQEMVAEGFIYNGEYYNLGFADREYFHLEKLFIPSKTLFPSVLPQSVLDRIVDCEKKMAAYVKPAFAIVHSEYLYNPLMNEIRVVESALRGGGVYISSHLIPLATGIDINDILLDCMEGKPVDMEAVLKNKVNRAAGYICFYLPEGRVISVNGIEECSHFPFVKKMDVKGIYAGMTSPPLTHKGQRLGPIIIDADNGSDLKTNVEVVKRTLCVNVEGTNGDVCGINWD